MPFSRFEKMTSEKRERLLTIAAQEFAAYGFEMASFNRILEQARIGKSSAYYYFEGKADLFCTVVNYCIDRLQLAPERETLASLTAETYWVQVAAMRDQPLQRTFQHPWLFGVIRAAEHLTPASLRQASLGKLAEYLTTYSATGLGALIKRGQELGLIRTDVPDELLYAWFRAIDDASDSWVLAHLDQLNQETLLQISHQTVATIK